MPSTGSPKSGGWYEIDWENEPEFKDWLAPVLDNPRKAACNFCDMEFRAHRSTLLVHTYSKTHIEKLSNLICKTETLEDSFSSECPDDLKLVEIITKPKNWSKKMGIHYNKKWERIPALQDWIKPHHSDESRAYCSLCDCSFRAHKSDVKGHLKSRKHRMNLNLSSCEINQSIRKLEEVYPGNESIYNVEIDSDALRDWPNEFVTENEDCFQPANYAESVSDQDEFTLKDQISDIANKASQVIIEDLNEILTKKRGIIRSLKEEDFYSQENGCKKMAMALIGVLSQQYLIESAMEDWEDSKNSKESSSDEEIDLGEKLDALAERLENHDVALDCMELEENEENLESPLNNENDLKPPKYSHFLDLT